MYSRFYWTDALSGWTWTLSYSNGSSWDFVLWMFSVDWWTAKSG